MRITSAIGLIVFLAAFDALFGVSGSVAAIFARLADIPEISHRTDNPAVFELGVRLAYLIALLGLARLLLFRGKRDE